MVANPARGHLRKEKIIFPAPIRVWKFGSSTPISRVDTDVRTPRRTEHPHVNAHDDYTMYLVRKLYCLYGKL